MTEQAFEGTLGAMENAPGDEGPAPAEADSASPLQAESAGTITDEKQALLDSLESVHICVPGLSCPKPIEFLPLYEPVTTTTGTELELRLTCPFCPADFGTCSHPQGVAPIQETS